MNPNILMAVAWGLMAGQCSSLSAQTLSKAADLRASPDANAKALKNLPSGTAVKLSKREGFWVEVDASGAKGWVKLSEVSMGQTPTAGIGALDTGRTGKGNIVTTSAARGLSAKELVAAKPDVQEFEQLKLLAVNPQEAEQFAQAAGLKTRNLALLASPVSAVSPSAGKPSSEGGGKGKKSKTDDDDDDS